MPGQAVGTAFGTAVGTAVGTAAGARPGRVTALCGLMQGVGGGLGWSLVPPLMADMARDLHLSHAAGGLVWGAAPLGIALASPVGGAAVDRFGARRVATAAMAFGAVTCAARALCTDAATLAGAMFAFGLHIGFVAPAIPKALAGHVALHRLGRANGFALVCYTLGTAVTLLTARTLLAPAVGGWRTSMLLAGAAMAVAAAAWWSGVRDRVVPSRHAGIGAVLALVRDGRMVRLASIQMLMFGAYLALLGLLPRLLGEAGWEPAAIGAAIAAWLGTAAVANIAGPVVSERLGRRRPLIVAGTLIAAVALAGAAAFPAVPPAAWLVLAAVGGGAFAPLLLSLPLEMDGIGPARAGAALGMLMLLGQVGGAVLPVVAGAAAGAGGLPAAFALLALAHLAIVPVARGLVETGPAARRPAQARAEIPALAS